MAQNYGQQDSMHSLKYFSLLVLVSLFQCTPLAYAKDPPFQLPSTAEVTKIKSAHIKTTKGILYFELFPETAPIHVANFKFLADQGFYRGTSFKGYFNNYIIQAKPTAKKQYSLPPEFSAKVHKRGTLGMARWEDALNPERRSSPTEFHILLRDGKHMDNNYTIFGTLIKGWETLDRLETGDSILDVIVYIRSNNR
jgi:cyclophilin family peptidyl-prolyl cis-trans isomerase